MPRTRQAVNYVEESDDEQSEDTVVSVIQLKPKSRLVSDFLADNYHDMMLVKPECCVCFQQIPKNNFALSICGHYLCYRCHVKTDNCPMCRK